jgi:hypothetical protein
MWIFGTVVSMSPWNAQTGTRPSAQPAWAKASLCLAGDEHGTGHDLVYMSAEIIPGSDGTAADSGEIHAGLVDVVVIERESEERVDLVGKPAILCRVLAVLRHQHDEGTILGPTVILDEHRDAELE